MRRFGVGHWCLHVDMDEALVFPMLDHGRDLRDLTNYLSAQGHGCTESMMIDMVPSGFPGQVKGGSASFEQCLHFDPDLVSMPSELPPYRFIKGGVRSRVTGRSLLMTKSPLVRMKPDFAYLGGMQRRRRLLLNSQIQSIFSTWSHLSKGRVGIHVRRTDHSSAISLSPDESFYVFLDGQEGDFFLCTDDEEVEKSFFERYGNRITSYKKRSRERDKEIAIQDALIDLCLLAECRFIVSSSASTFSSCASFWGGKPLHRIMRYA